MEHASSSEPPRIPGVTQSGAEVACTSPVQHRDSRRTSTRSPSTSMHKEEIIGHSSAAGQGKQQDGIGNRQPGLENDEYLSTPSTVHHGLPTPKSVVNKSRLFPKTPAASIHETTTASHTVQASSPNHATSPIRRRSKGQNIGSGDVRILGPGVGAPALISRFSNSQVTASTGSGESRTASLRSGFHDSRDAASQEGEFLAQLALKRKDSIRSRASKRTSSLRTGHVAISVESGVTPTTPRMPNKAKEGNEAAALVARESSQSQWATHRRTHTH